MPGASFSPRIAFVYGDRPSGHSAAAAALEEELRAAVPGALTTQIPLSTDVAPFVGPVISAAYLSLIQKAPRLWDYLYDNRAVAAVLKELREPLSALHRLRLRRRFRAFEPDLVVCTHALACAVVETDRARGLLRAPVAGVLTDFGVHEYWLSPAVDLYLAPSEAVRKELRSRGIAAGRIRVTGIPVHPRFREPHARDASRKSFGLRPWGPVVLFEGGSRGLGPIAEMIDPVLAQLPEAQVLAVCGRNVELFLGLRARYGRQPRVRALAFTTRMPECFAAADVLVGKPGGVTASEAAACGLPLVIVGPLPGPERKNCAYLTGRGAALKLEDPRRLGASLRRLLRSPRRLEAMRKAARAVAPLDSAARACGHLLRLLEGTRR